MPVIRLFLGILKLINWVDWFLGTIVFGIIAIIKGIYRSMTAQKEEPTHGDAAFATDKELKEQGMLKPGGFFACVTPKRRKVYLPKTSSLLIVANKRQGKTQAINANLLDLRNRPWVTETVEVGGNRIKRRRQDLPDLVMYDPKLGTLKRTRPTLEKLGYKVLVIDIDNPDNTEAWINPVTFLDIHDVYDFDRQNDVFADLLAADAKHGKHSHFDNYPKIMIAGVIKYLLLKQPSKATVPHAVDLLVSSNESREALFAMMALVEDPIITAAVDAFRSAGDREKGSFITTNFEKMKVWLRPSIRAITEHRDAEGLLVNTFTWEQVFTDDAPVAVFIRCGLGTGEGALVRLLIGCAINSAKRMFNATGDTPLRKGLWVIVDEAKTIERCNALLDVNRELGEAGVNLLVAYLSESDIKEAFQQDAEALIGGCSLLVYGGSNEIGWLERISKLLGKRTSYGRSESASQHGTSQGRSETPTNLRNLDQIAAMGFMQCILIVPGRAKVDGLKPFKLVKRLWRKTVVEFYQ